MALLADSPAKEKQGLPGLGNQLARKLPFGVLMVVARSVLIAATILSLTWVGALIGDQSDPISDTVGGVSFLPVLLEDMRNSGLVKAGDKAVLIGGAPEAAQGLGLEVEMASEARSVANEVFDFAYIAGFNGVNAFVDRALRVGGVAAVRLSQDPGQAFRVPPNFSIVYIRRFEATVVGIKKLTSAAPARRRLLNVVKKEALNGLEDALLEPPRSASKESKLHLRRIKYLPELTGVSLDEYPRRVFIAVGGGGEGWFERNYPVMNRDFETYQVEVAPDGPGEASPAVGISEWLQRNVREEEYVVMKAEAEVAEELLTSGAVALVDELFLECHHQGQKGNRKVKSRRAYWECLALYGKLRDEGVAVHQWWE